jgi:hypothetical protein
MDNPWLLFAFLSLFHVVGAAVLANALRGLWRNLRERALTGCRSAFLVVWAAMFGCLPLAFGLGFAGQEAGMPLFLIGEILVWGTTFLTVLLAEQALKEIFEPFLHQETFLILLGGVFVVTGVGVVTLMVGEEELGGMLAGGIFILLGGSVFGYGLWRLLTSTR